MQDVAADLRAEVDVLGLPLLARNLLLAGAFLAFDELRAQHRHRRRLVRGLRSLVLALHDDATRAVGDPHRGIRLVDVLAAGPAGPVGVDLEVIVVQLDLAVALDDGCDLDAGEARLATARGVERGDAHEPVDALLGAVEPVGVLAADAEGGGLDAGLLPRADLEQLDRESALLSPAHLHPQNHLRPVLGVGAAGAGVDRHERVTRVVGAGEQALLLERQQPCLDRFQLPLELAREVRILFGQLDERLEVLDVGGDAAEGLESAGQARVFGAGLGRRLGVVPEPGLAHLCLERRDALGERCGVKDSPRAAEAGRESPRDAPASAPMRRRSSCPVTALELLARATPAGIVAPELLIA